MTLHEPVSIPELFFQLGVALALGLLIGLERGWRERKADEGRRVAGIRTFALIGLLGGLFGLLGRELGPLLPGLGFLALAGVQTAAYIVQVREKHEIGITTLVSGLLTFVLGVVATTGHPEAASAFAVIVTFLLRLKPQVHGLLELIDGREIHAGLILLLISVVVLPVLPNQGYGPWEALNPYAIWWMVVLIASISFLGYFAIRIGGAKRGILFTGLFAGLMSSTALTLQFSRTARVSPQATAMLATGILLACGTMFPRMLFIAWVLNRELLPVLWLPVAVMALIVYGTAMLLWLRHSESEMSSVEAVIQNPLQLKSAIVFGALLATVMLLGAWLKVAVGDGGVLALALASGVADVDAISLSLAKMSREDLGIETASLGMVLAASSNNVVKASMAAGIAGRRLGMQVGIPLSLSALAGSLVAL